MREYKDEIALTLGKTNVIISTIIRIQSENDYLRAVEDDWMVYKHFRSEIN